MAISAASLLMTVEVVTDKAREQVRSMGAEAEGLGSNFIKSGALMASGMLAGATAAVKLGESIAATAGEAEKQQSAMAQINQVLKSTHDASGLSAEGISAYAEKLSDMTDFSKLAYLQASQMMLQFTHIGRNVFPEAELAAANLASRFGLDLPKAARLVGIALEDPAAGLGRLQRYIGPLDASTKAYIKTLEQHGETAKAQAVVIDLLNSKFGGAAQTATTTFAGAITLARNRMQEMGIGVVNAVLPGLTSLAVGFNNVTSNLGAHLQPVLDSFSKWLSGAATGILPAFNAVWNQLAAVWKGLQPTIEALRPSVERVVGAVAGLVPVGAQAATSFNGFSIISRTLLPVLQTLLPVLVSVGATILSALGTALKQILPSLINLTTAISATLSPVLKTAATDAAPLVQTIGTLLVNAVTTLGPLVKGIADGLTTLVKSMNDGTPAGTALRDVVLGIAGAFAAWNIGAFIADLVKATAAMVGNTVAWYSHTTAMIGDRIVTLQIMAIDLWGNVTKTTAAVWSSVSGWVAHAAAVTASWVAQRAMDFGSLVRSIITSIPAIVAQTAAWAANAVAVLAATWPILAVIAAIGAVIAIGILLVTHWKQVTDFIGNVWKGAFTFLSNLWTGFTTFLHTILDNIVGAIVGAFQTAYNHSFVFKAIVDFIVGVVTGLWKTLGAIWSAILYTLTTAWNLIKATAQTAWNDLTGLISNAVNLEMRYISTVWNAITGVLGGIWTGIKNVATSVWNAISGFIGTQVAYAQWVISTTWNAVVKFLSDIWNGIRDTASRLWATISSTIGGAAQGLWNNITKVLGTLSGWFSNLWTDMKNGFIGAMSNSWNDIKNALGTLAGNIITTVKNLLGIHSPSTVFADIGKNAILGFIQGFTGNDIGGHILQFINNSLGGMGGVVKSLVDAGLLDLSQLGDKGVAFLKSLGGVGQNILGSLGNFFGSLFGGGGDGTAAMLNGMPALNQLKLADVNNRDDCVPTSLAAGASELLHRIVNPATLKDVAYGVRYQGMESPDRFGPVLNQLGVTLGKIVGSPAFLVGSVVRELQAGRPVVAAIPSQWNLPSDQANNFSHIVAFARVAGNLLTAMNPWGGFWQTESQDWWRQRIRFGEVWPLSRSSGGAQSGGGHTYMDFGGWVTEPVAGVGLTTGTQYGFAWNGRPEYVSAYPGGAPSGQPSGAPIVIHVHGDMTESTAVTIARERAWQARLHGGY